MKLEMSKINILTERRRYLKCLLDDDVRLNLLSKRIADDILDRFDVEEPIYYNTFENVKPLWIQRALFKRSYKKALASSFKIIEKYYDEIRDDNTVRLELIKQGLIEVKSP